MQTCEDQTELFSRVERLLKKKVDKKNHASLKKFLGAFDPYRYLETLKNKETEKLAEDLEKLWLFIQKKSPDEPKISVYYWRPDPVDKRRRPERIIINIINENMPFLVDSLTQLLNRLGFQPRLMVHPVLRCERDSQGRLRHLEDHDTPSSKAKEESLIYCEIMESVTPQCVELIQSHIPSMMTDVHAATSDWSAMKQRVSDAVETLHAGVYEKDQDQLDEIVQFLEWARDDHFTFLGYCKYDLFDGKGRLRRTPKASAPLGILKDKKQQDLNSIFEGIGYTNETRRLILKSAPLIINKATQISRVHRSVPMDAIGVRCLNKEGKVVALHMFLGLFTSIAYDSSARDIPYLRRKVDRVLERAGLGLDWHDGKALIHTLDSLPRDELFQASIEELKDIGMAIVRLQEHQRVALFLRPDIFKRSMSCMVYVPQDRFDSTLVEAMGEALAEELGGKIGVVKAQFGSLAFARVYYSIHVSNRLRGSYDFKAIENRLLEIAKSWSDELRLALNAQDLTHQRSQLFRAYRNAFSRGYQDRFSGVQVAEDIYYIERLYEKGGMSSRVYTADSKDLCLLKLKIFQFEKPIPLSDILPTLENLGLRIIGEVPFKVTRQNEKQSVWIHDFELESQSACSVNLTQSAENFLSALKKVYQGKTEDDGFNRLVMAADLTWRQCEIIRTYARYLKQLGFPLSEAYIQSVLAKNPQATQELALLFEARFNPDKELSLSEDALLKKIEQTLGHVTNADEDRLLRRYLNLILSTLRTNFFQTDETGGYKPCIALKIDCACVEDMPLPRPLYEIFVYSPRMEGVHLRGGRVARGGIRWSDRLEDFRTEILGLMKAQMVKNTVIIPVGSKGGFIVKKSMDELSREEFLQEGIACYKIMMQGLLDLTDNLVQEKVVSPRQTVLHDEQDPYLVVAADKGTATFSDYANEISLNNGFWLGDAFASGGSQGYDHKKMGITARGAWESVKRHFRELGLDVATTPFTVVGVGDMSGDVFGNGMLLSRVLKLVGAFNHRHIFIDPNPDPEESFRERERLFSLPRSSWDDYDKKVLSKGGAVYDRHSKYLQLTPEIKEMLTLSETKIKPEALIRALLSHRIDLLWFGGIGTYVKASQESHADVGDRANDGIRVTAKELNCRVIGEGANLGMTHQARIEFVRRAKGRVNTDAVDNSAGVDCSDHEVNIKILLGKAQENGHLSVKVRNKRLREMTKSVAQLVLRDNYLQNLALSLMESLGTQNFTMQVRLIRHLETEGILNRSLEGIPDDGTLTEMASADMPFTRPEIAVIMAYAKIYLYKEVLTSDLVEDPYLEGHLLSYFPDKLRSDFMHDILKHPLRSEIIATQVINEAVNRTGASFIYEIFDKTGASYKDIFRAYFIATDVFGFQNMWAEIEDYDGKIEASQQINLYKDLKHTLKRTVLWLLKNYPLQEGSITDVTTQLSHGVQAFLNSLTTCLDIEGEDKLAAALVGYQDFGIDLDFAERLAVLKIAASSPDIILVATQTGFTISEVGTLYFLVGSRFQFGKVRELVRHIIPSGQWQRLQINGLLEDLYENHRALVYAILMFAREKGLTMDQGGITLVAEWEMHHKGALQRLDRVLSEAGLGQNTPLENLSVVARELRHLSH